MGIFKDDLYRGQHVFITGGSSGINLGLAFAFGELGAKVSINGRKQDKLDEAVKQLKAKGIDARGYAADVRDFAAVEAMLAQASAHAGPVKVLVCGAAGNFPAPVVGLSSNGFNAVVGIDLLGTFHACRAGFEHLVKPGGVVLAISAPQAQVPYPLQAHVCAAKAGVDMLVKTLALEWGGVGVRVCSIWPGPIAETEGMSRLAPDEKSRVAVEKQVPLQRFGTKAEVAQLALFLGSDAASYCTGAVYAADGGMALMGAGLFAALSS